jgi:hypothetical protein
MLAKVESAMSLRTPLLYNEQKVDEKKALFLDAHNFWQEKEDLTFREKQQRFNNLTVLNDRSEKKIIHISVNFHPDDQLTDRQMTTLATEFMKGIEFGNQPWLVYRHIDAGHPHMHIVTTNIRPDGSRISNDLRAPYHLEQLCGNIAEEHRLTPVHHESELYTLSNREENRCMQRLIYGEMPTRTGIEKVLKYVLKEYTFTSFEGYNAALGLYNVRADRGNPDGLMYQNRGLYYRIIDEEGKKLGAPIKASDFHLPVTLNAIEEKCKLSQALVEESVRERVRVNIDFHLCGDVQNLGAFRKDLLRENIHTIIPAFTQRNTRGDVPADRPGMFFVDFDHMTVFRDTDLGKEYTAAAILHRCGLDKTLPELAKQQQLELKPGERPLLDGPDRNEAQTRDLLLRLSVQHDRLVEAQEETLRQTHHLRHSL